MEERFLLVNCAGHNFEGAVAKADGTINLQKQWLLLHLRISLFIMALYGQQSVPVNPANPDWIALAIFGVGFFVLRKWKLHPVCVMAGAGAAGVLLYSVF